MQLFSPQIRIMTQRYIFSQGVEVEIGSGADTYYDWAKLRFTRPFEQTVTISNRERVQLQLGYNDSYDTVFTGYAATDFTSGSYANEVLLKDGMLLLADVTVNHTFVQATPQDIVRFIAGQAGVRSLQLDSGIYQPRAAVPIFQKTGIQALGALGNYWPITPKFFFQDDTLFWGTSAQQTKLYHFEYGKNIIDLQLQGGHWELLTVSVPFIKHSQQIKITHPELSGTFPVHRVRVTTKTRGFIRTSLYFRA